jgi:hypothetical protein
MAITIALMRASRLTDKSYISQVKIGVNYRFSPGVVVAKY